MSGKRRAVRLLRETAAQLGIDADGGWFRLPHAVGVVEGAEVSLRLTQDREVVGEGYETRYGSDGARIRYGSVHGETTWGVAASSHHGPIGAGLRIVPTSVPVAERDSDRTMLTGDPEFDDAVHLTAGEWLRTQDVLDDPTRATVVAFFDSGAQAEIRDDRIRIASPGRASALASQMRNAARMSRVIDERLAELG